MHSDVLALEGEAQKGIPLLQPVMRAGKRLASPAPLSDLRTRAAQELQRLPNQLRRLDPAPPYPVNMSQSLQSLCDALDKQAQP